MKTISNRKIKQEAEKCYGWLRTNATPPSKFKGGEIDIIKVFQEGAKWYKNQIKCLK